MKKNKLTIFFRNDDPDVSYFGDKREMLYRLTDLFIKEEIPLVHAVVPNTITDQTISYFQDMNENSNLLEFIQHGWQHSLYERGEFDSSRSYEKQQKDIIRGKERLFDLFGNNFFLAFSAPYGVYTNETFDILENEGFRVVSSAVRFATKNKIFNMFGRLLKKKVLFGKRVSYHDNSVLNLNLKEISISINIIKKNSSYEMLNNKKILETINFVSAFTNNIGILIHHINLRNDHFVKLNRLLDDLRLRNYRFSKLSSIYARI